MLEREEEFNGVCHGCLMFSNSKTIIRVYVGRKKLNPTIGNISHCEVGLILFKVGSILKKDKRNNNNNNNNNK